uniref:Uncharacterized protein n=1 Tax=viral metagenome TaxID=1070528 RepID=A0A6M3KDQ0_9ZZZZ
MNISVIHEDSLDFVRFTGGECAEMNLVIRIDKNLPIREQRLLAIHAVYENFHLSVSHERVDEFMDDIVDILDKVEALND